MCHVRRYAVRNPEVGAPDPSSIICHLSLKRKILLVPVGGPLFDRMFSVPLPDMRVGNAGQ